MEDQDEGGFLGWLRRIFPSLLSDDPRDHRRVPGDEPGEPVGPVLGLGEQVGCEADFTALDVGLEQRHLFQPLLREQGAEGQDRSAGTSRSFLSQMKSFVLYTASS